MPDTAPAPASVNYLDPHTLAAIGSLELRARMVVEGLMTGMHRSPYQGSAVEFAQHRQYAPGDDIRRLDWKVFARTDKLYLKQYQKETNLDLVLMVDVSGSMGYGSGREGTKGLRDEGTKGQRRGAITGTADGRSSPSVPQSLSPSVPSWRKYDHAATIAAAMAYLSLRQQDRVGLVLFASDVRHATRLSNAHDHWRTIAEVLSAVTLIDEDQASHAPPEAAPRQDGDDAPAPGTTPAPGPGSYRGTDLARVFDQALAKITRRSVIVLLSDLFDAAESLERGLARLHHRRHDLIVLQTLDPAERTFPFRGPADFVGLEREGRLGLDPAAIRKAYLEALGAHLERVEQATRKFHFDYVLLDTSESLAAPLSHFLARRTAAIGKGK